MFKYTSPTTWVLITINEREYAMIKAIDFLEGNAVILELNKRF